MRKLLPHKSLLLATAAAASLALAACSGGSDNTDATAGAQPTARASNAAANESVAGNPSTEGRVLAADAGAATQEPR
jgi:hypothetical protein